MVSCNYLMKDKNMNISSFQYLVSAIFLSIVTSCLIECRNPRRPVDTSIPTITVSSCDPEYACTWAAIDSGYEPLKSDYQLKNRYLRINPIKNGFNQEYFQKHLLPENTIEFRNKTGSVSGSTLSHLAQELLEEIKVGQKKFSNFKILKDRDFNYQTLSGLLILKYKNYPFVLKISIEHPHTMVQPFSKSLEATGIFVIGGNLRHLTNFTRISNLERIKNILNYNPFYLQSLSYPRKWFWKPEKIHDLKVVWNCNGQQDTIFLPNVYATVSDFIEAEAYQPQADLNRLSMKVATDTGFLIDPHSGNIVIEKDTHKYVLLDTEDFRMMAGLDRSMKAKKYVGWYIELVCNSIQTMLFRTKKERLKQSTVQVNLL
jgi:hypothetical protein